eukprot:CAMPEP_0198732326 /NCGR_PEP_ID=MMETSP1475-20131203/35060_1 /TAXON_ID= ORGANISM="Unidentified sp., Strain CCMP1999" /NCGR_SAMPLE_ID=MMETSP1475 /ASSEMBLY_ACC=CAM_ASM_001111 /LENGTH=198 /DNA_ID=CAMNT_0044495403 /DNA_START=549 /DNA_END=1144 /DNA_ORIENTATION=-
MAARPRLLSCGVSQIRMQMGTGWTREPADVLKALSAVRRRARVQAIVHGAEPVDYYNILEARALQPRWWSEAVGSVRGYAAWTRGMGAVILLCGLDHPLGGLGLDPLLAPSVINTQKPQRVCRPRYRGEGEVRGSVKESKAANTALFELFLLTRQLQPLFCRSSASLTQKLQHSSCQYFVTCASAAAAATAASKTYPA